MERLSMSLDQIIANRERSNNNKVQNQNRGGSQLNHKSRQSTHLNIKGSAGSRSARQVAPYQQLRSFSRRPSNDTPVGLRKDSAAIKFLLSNYLSGIFIGNGGSSIREMEQLCDASIHISNLHDNYPGTKDRVVFMSGSEPAVTLAQSLMWEMIGQQTYADSSKKGPLLWDPTRAKDAPGQYDDITVEGKITIPALGAGAIIGRGGTTIKTLASETGVEVTLDAKEDAEFTHERVVTIAGTVAQCMNFTSMILHRLVENNEATYVISGSTYPKRPNSSFGGSSNLRSKMDHVEPQSLPSSFPNTTQQSSQQIQSTPSLPHATGRPTNNISESELFDPTVKTTVCAETLSAFTTIELAVPDSIIGGILGSHGATLNEIIALSGASITVSKRGEYLEGTSNRLVTITGSPPCAQTAHTLIIHKLRQY